LIQWILAVFDHKLLPRFHKPVVRWILKPQGH
jgi:hypothetical protein